MLALAALSFLGPDATVRPARGQTAAPLAGSTLRAKPSSFTPLRRTPIFATGKSEPKNIIPDPASKKTEELVIFSTWLRGRKTRTEGSTTTKTPLGIGPLFAKRPAEPVAYSPNTSTPSVPAGYSADLFAEKKIQTPPTAPSMGAPFIAASAAATATTPAEPVNIPQTADPLYSDPAKAMVAEQLARESAGRITYYRSRVARQPASAQESHVVRRYENGGPAIPGVAAPTPIPESERPPVIPISAADERILFGIEPESDSPAAVATQGQVEESLPPFSDANTSSNNSAAGAIMGVESGSPLPQPAQNRTASAQSVEIVDGPESKPVDEEIEGEELPTITQPIAIPIVGRSSSSGVSDAYDLQEEQPTDVTGRENSTAANRSGDSDLEWIEEYVYDGPLPAPGSNRGAPVPGPLPPPVGVRGGQSNSRSAEASNSAPTPPPRSGQVGQPGQGMGEENRPFPPSGQLPRRTPGATSQGNRPGPLPGPIPPSTPQTTVPSVPAMPQPTMPARPSQLGQQPPGKGNLSNQPLDLQQQILLQAARNAYSLGNLELAAERYENLLDRFPDDPTARGEYAGILVQLNRLEEAEAQFRELIDIDPDNLGYRQALADIYLQRKKFDQAEVILAEIMVRQPENKQAASTLARIYVLGNKRAEAIDVYNKYLRDVDLSSKEAPELLGKLLLELQRPKEALPLLERLYRADPTSLETIADVVRAHAELGQFDAMIGMIQTMATVKPTELAQRQYLAGSLEGLGLYDAALMVYEQILTQAPNNLIAIIGSARARTDQFLMRDAKTLLDRPKLDCSYNRDYLLALANWHVTMGEYAEAKLIYVRLLHKDSNDNEARQAYAQLLLNTSELEPARGEYCKIIAVGDAAYQARLGIARVLTAERKFKEADTVARQLIAEYPTRGPAVAVLGKNLAKNCCVDEAIAIMEEFLRQEPATRQDAIVVRIQLAETLYKAGKPLEAREQYELVLCDPFGRIPDTYYGLYRSYIALGETGAAQNALFPGPHPIGGAVRFLMLLSDRALEDGDYSLAATLAQQVLDLDPGNVPALNRMGEAQAGTGEEESEKIAISTFKTALEQSPTNVRARLGLARNYLQMNEFDSSLIEYQRLVQIDSQNLYLKRERARALFAVGGYDMAAGAYMELLRPSADEKLRADLAALYESDPAIDQQMGMMVRADLCGDALCGSISRTADQFPGSKTAYDLQRLLIDHEVLSNMQTSFTMEMQEKERRYWRNFEAIPILQGLTAFEPSNEEAFFDLGQTFAELDLTNCAIEQYSELLEINPHSKIGQVAMEGEIMDLNFRLNGGYQYLGQNGRNGLATIQRFFWGGAGTYPYGDADEFVSLGYRAAYYVPNDDRPLSGNIYTVAAQRKPNDHLILRGAVNIEEYPTRLTTRPLFNLAMTVRPNDLFKGTLAAYMENVIENGESLRQDIYRGGVSASTVLQLRRRLASGGAYTVMFYSDNNTEHALNAFSAFLVTRPPKEFKVVMSGDFMGYTQQTIFGPDPNNPVFQSVHPYFAPEAYAWGTLSAEWTQWCSEYWFNGAPQTWYSVRYSPRLDSQSEYFHVARGIFHWDIRTDISMECDVNFIRSKVYNLQQANVYFIWKTPCR